jgi:23S rRNA pseudouridine2605 synthase
MTPPKRPRTTSFKARGERNRIPAAPSEQIHVDSPNDAADLTNHAGGSYRLQKVLAAAGLGSRRYCEELIVQGRVSVDGQPVTTLGATVDPTRQAIRCDGELVRPERKVYWWLNKPPGVLCTCRDTHGRATVRDLLPSLRQRVYPVGRLDESSTGLLLLTNDGEMADRLTHPRYQIPKTYLVLVAGRVDRAILHKLLRGVWLAEGKCRPASITRGKSQGDATWLKIVLCEGRNREIRRMFARCGHKVLRLERVAIGPIKIRKLRRGEARPATRQEIEMLQVLIRRGPRPRRV